MEGRVKGVACVLAAVGITSFTIPVPANDAKLRAYGKQLSSQCTTCHRIDGSDDRIPSIVGWRAEDLVWVLKAYKDGGRTAPEMAAAVKGLDETQMQALASYLGSLKPHRRLR